MPDARARTPKPAPDQRDPRGAPLSSTDGFILSRVDGTLDELEIASLSGLPDEIVLASLRKLESLGFITFDGVRSPSPRATTAAPARPAGSPQASRPPFSPQGTRGAPISTARADPDAMPAPTDAAVLAEDVELDIDLRRQILGMYRGLERADHYATLKVDHTADRKALKRAYYELAAKFHPDRYFRKNLGSYKLRMESIFGRITLAHDTLTDKQRRAEYDEYLEEQRRSRGIEDLLADALAEAKRTEERIELEAQEQEPLSLGPTPTMQRSGSQPSVSPSPSSFAAASSPAEAAARRDTLARRLLGGRPQPNVAGPVPGSKSPPGAAADAVASLRRRYEERVAGAKASQTRKYAVNAQAALAAGDPVAAANAFRVALTLSPNDPELIRTAQAAQQQADAILSEAYSKQAGYEEKNGQWVEASRSWARVVKARPADAAAHDRGANALVKAGGDLHEAARVAQVACAIEPANSAFRVTLANVYLAAGLTLNARRELESAAQLAPHDGTIQAMLQRVGKS